MICPQCQSVTREDSAFCQECGARLAPAQTPRIPAEASPSSPPTSASPSRTPPQVKVAAPPAPGQSSTGKYFTASAVVTTLMVLGWLTVAGGFFGGIAAAESCEQSSSGGFFESSSLECDSGDKVIRFIAVLAFAWVIAIWFFWSGYVLRFLSDIYNSLRNRQL